MGRLLRSHRLLFLLPIALVASGAATARAELIVGVGSTTTSANVLIRFDSATPMDVASVAVMGVTGSLVDIDYRPANGALYGLSSSNALYTINPTTGVAALVSTVSVAVSGQASIDFNPTVDRLRIVSTSTQNLRVNVDTGVAIVDTPLSVANVVSAAYTNSAAGATSTTLYDLTYGGTSLTLNTQAPPNNGTVNPIGSTGINTPVSLVGFDISGTSGQAYVGSNASDTVGGNVPRLSTISLATGNIASFAAINAAGFQIRGLATPPPPVPEPTALAALGVASVAACRRRRPR